MNEAETLFGDEHVRRDADRQQQPGRPTGRHEPPERLSKHECGNPPWRIGARLMLRGSRSRTP